MALIDNIRVVVIPFESAITAIGIGEVERHRISRMRLNVIDLAC